MNRHVALDEKLSVLQESDPVRQWHSLDDKRVCVLCDRVISGRMIDVWQDDRGGFHLHCPTAGCPALPRDWLYHGPMRSAARKRLPPVSLGSRQAA
ncbi:MAG: hypothetical protein ABI540_09965 [Spartobacteria bacterium]